MRFRNWLFVCTVSIALGAQAFDFRHEEQIHVGADQTVNNDVYLAANQVVVDGVINGDVVAFAQTVTINGTVHGSLWTAAQTVIVNGTVDGSVRTAGAVLNLGPNAHIGRDLIGAGASLEVASGASVGRDLAFGGGQMSLNGSVGGNLNVAGRALTINAPISGNAQIALSHVEAKVLEHQWVMKDAKAPVPAVPQGLSFGPNAKIVGTLTYWAEQNIAVPQGVVQGQVYPHLKTYAPPTVTPPVSALWEGFRHLLSVLLLGVVLFALMGGWLKRVKSELLLQPGRSFVMGVVGLAMGVALLLMTVVAGLFLSIFFAALGLVHLAFGVAGLGLLVFLTLLFFLVMTYKLVAWVVVGFTLGALIMRRSQNEASWLELVLGSVILSVIVAVLSLPALPHLVAAVVCWAVGIFGLGAIVGEKLKKHI